jgi:hypothetical protein
MPPLGSKYCCPPLWTPGQPHNLDDCIPFQPETRDPLPRRLWSTIDPDKDKQLLDDLGNGYRALRRLCPDDPRSLIRQAWLHAFYCAGHWSGGDVHSTWAFLPWHRAFIYFHEKILAGVIGKPEFRLPVWDWENNRNIPRFFKDLGLPTFLTGTAGRWPDWSQNWVSPCLVQAWFLSKSFLDFCGSPPCSQDPCTATPPQPATPCTPPAPGRAFGGVHGFVHAKLVGGAMRDPSTAAADPIFYAHHANMDRFWWYWRKVYGESAKFAIPEGFSKQAFYFYDENRQLVRVEAGQLLHEADLGYRYDEPGVSHCEYETLSLDMNLLSDAQALQLEMRRLTVGALRSAGQQSITGIWTALREPQIDYRGLLGAASCFSSFPVQIVATLTDMQAGKLVPGQYYMVLLQNASGAYPVAGFAVFASAEHLKMGPMSVAMTGCIEPGLYHALLHSVGSFQLVYGKLEDSATRPATTQTILDSKLQFNILYQDGYYQKGKELLNLFGLQ